VSKGGDVFKGFVTNYASMLMVRF